MLFFQDGQKVKGLLLWLLFFSFLRVAECLRILQIFPANYGKSLFLKKSSRLLSMCKIFKDTDVIAENVVVLIFLFEMNYIVHVYL